MIHSKTKNAAFLWHFYSYLFVTTVPSFFQMEFSGTNTLTQDVG